jgi:hypothetical protein
MPTKYTGRLTLISSVLVLATICIVPPQTMFNYKLPWRRVDEP